MPRLTINSGALFLSIAKPLFSAVVHRQLLKQFVVRDIKGRFAGSAAGILWAVMNPLATIVVYLFVFSLVLRVSVSMEETGTNLFSVFFLSGLLPWLLFAEGLSRSVGCLLENSNLITKVVFPVELLPAGAVLSAYIVNAIGLLFFIGYLSFIGYLHLTWFVLPFIVIAEFFFTWGIASFLSAAAVFIRDIQELLGIGLMIMFFSTPIIYPASMVPVDLSWLLHLNPMAVFVSAIRDVVLRHQVNPTSMIAVAALGFFSYALGSWFFMRAKSAFGDVL